MILRKWENLPENMKCPEVKKYYDILRQHTASLLLKRVFDVIIACILLVILSPAMLLLAVIIKLDSPGPAFFRQVRITSYGRAFKMFKFRTMVNASDKKGAEITTTGDARITTVGKIIRKCRLDEIAQLFDVIRGTMTFVGVRPEVPKYVDQYKPEWLATLLLPAGVTNITSICYSDEGRLLAEVTDIDQVYLEKLLPRKMELNLQEIEKFSLWRDISVMFITFLAMCGKKYIIEEIDVQ